MNFFNVFYVLCNIYFTLFLLLLFGCDSLDKKNQYHFQYKISYQHDENKYNCNDCHLTDSSTNSIFSNIKTNLFPPNISDFNTKCVACHENLNENIMSPHNLNLDVSHLKESKFDCSYCHFEHKGLQDKNILLYDKNCTNCHTNKSTNYLEIHNNTSYSQPIINWKFNHTEHENIHFNKFDQIFKCENCHQLNKKGVFNSINFENACTSCHHHQEQFSQKALSIIQLPGLDYEILMDEGVEIGEWPIGAGIDLEKSISPFILSELSKIEQKIYQNLIEDEIELYDLTDATDYLEEIGTLIWGLKNVLLSFKNPNKLKEIYGIDNSNEIKLIIKTIDNWFPNLNKEISEYKNGNSTNTVEYEDYDTNNFKLNQISKIGFDFNLIYNAKDHKDYIFKTLYSNQNSKIINYLKAENPGNCLKCHDQNNFQNVIKLNNDMTSNKNSLIKSFLHSNHIEQKKCNDCHIINGDSFLPIQLYSCENCHTQNDENSCLSCHTYHSRKN